MTEVFGKRVEIRWVKTPNPEIVQGLRSDMKDKPPMIHYAVMKAFQLRGFVALKVILGQPTSLGPPHGFGTKSEAKAVCDKDANRPLPEQVVKMCDVLYIDPPRLLTEQDFIESYGEKDPKLCNQLWNKISAIQGTI